MDILLSIPIVFLVFILVLTGVYLWLSKFSAKGMDHKEKYLPYTGGQSLPPRESQLSYQDFFRLGLLFGIIHVAALVISTLPFGWDNHRIGLFYVIGIGISIFALVNIKPK